jgi:ribosome biogenesis protein NSA1
MIVNTDCSSSELFVSDNGSNLSAIDVRNGKVCYSYKGMLAIEWESFQLLIIEVGLPSAAASFTPISKSHLASVSLDRIFRLHSVFSPPAQSNAQQLKKGELIGQEFLKSTPIAVVWDEFEAEAAVNGDPEDGDEDIWEGMEVHGEDGNSTDGSKESDHEQKQSKAKKRMRK